MMTFKSQVISILVSVLALRSLPTEAQKSCITKYEASSAANTYVIGECKSECAEFESNSTDVLIECPFGEECCFFHNDVIGASCFQENTGIHGLCLSDDRCTEVLTETPEYPCPEEYNLCCTDKVKDVPCTGSYNGANATGLCSNSICYHGKVFAEDVDGACPEDQSVWEFGCCIEDPERCIGEGEYQGQTANFEGVCRSDCGDVAEIPASVAPCPNSQACCIGERTVCVEETTDYLVGFCISECGNLTEYNTSARATCQDGLKCCGAAELGEPCMATHEGELLEGKCNAISYCGPEGVAGENGNCSDSASYCCVEGSSEPEPVTGVEAVMQALTAVFNMLFGWLG